MKKCKCINIDIFICFPTRKGAPKQIGYKNLPCVCLCIMPYESGINPQTGTLTFCLFTTQVFLQQGNQTDTLGVTELTSLQAFPRGPDFCPLMMLNVTTYVKAFKFIPYT